MPGTGAQVGSSQPMGVMRPILKTILEAGAAYPLLRELMSFAQVDKAKLTEGAKAAIGSLGTELTQAMQPVIEPEPTTNRSGNGKVASHVDPEINHS